MALCQTNHQKMQYFFSKVDNQDLDSHDECRTGSGPRMPIECDFMLI
jgi:hypothetical protein